MLGFRYLSERFNFMENMLGYTYNSGLGSLTDSNSVMLGSTLVEAMLSEVEQMCTQQDWGSKVYQQVCILYHVKYIRLKVR